MCIKCDTSCSRETWCCHTAAYCMCWGNAHAHTAWAQVVRLLSQRTEGISKAMLDPELLHDSAWVE